MSNTHIEQPFYGNVLNLWIVFLEDTQSIHCDVSYPQILDTTENYLFYLKIRIQKILNAQQSVLIVLD